MKKIWNARKDSEGVSPVIATILMVAITVVLAAILMVMVMGMTGDEAAPSATISATGATSGATHYLNVTVSFISKSVPVDTITFVTDAGTITPNTISWVGTPDSVSSGSVVKITGATAMTGTVYMQYKGAVVASVVIA